MHRKFGIIGAASAVSALLAAGPASAQKQGGTLRMYIWDNPPSASIHEEATVSTVTPFMSLYNNLVLYDQHKRLNTADGILPELAASWAWNDDKTKLGIYELDGDTYRYCLAPAGKPRPTEFASKEGSGHSLGASQRQKP